ncbi:MAG: glycosyltransferase 87 family protein [Candidatus Bruticola sp.]
MNSNFFIKENKKLIICWLILLALSIIGWLTHPNLIVFLYHPVENGGGYDFFHYYASVQALKNNLANIYDPEAMKLFSISLSNGKWAVFDNHPLPFYLLYLPFCQGSFAQGYIQHALWQYFLYAVGLLLLCKNLMENSLKSWITWALMAVGSFSWGLWIDNLLLGQVGGLFFFCLAATVICAWKKQDFGCGLALAISILLKLYPALLLFWLISKKKYKAAAYAILSLALLSLSAGLQWGFFRFSQYCSFVFTQQSYQEVVSNQSIMSIISSSLYDMPSTVIKFLNLLIIASTLYGLWQIGSSSTINFNSPSNDVSSNTETEQNLSAAHISSLDTENNNNSETISYIRRFALFTAEYGAWILAMLIISPLSWSHHHIVAIIPMLSLISLISSSYQKEYQIKLLWSCIVTSSLLILADSETLHGAALPIFYTIFQYKLILILIIIWETMLIMLIKNFRSLSLSSSKSEI